MIEIMPESGDGYLALRASGTLTRDDYDRVLIPRLDALLRRPGKIDVLFYMDDGFTGWDLQAAWEDMTYGLEHKAAFNKIAVVGGPAWVDLCIKLAGFLMKGEIKVFAGDRLDQARAWIKT